MKPVSEGWQQKQNSVNTSRFVPFLTWFTRKENIAVCLIAALIFTLHLLTIAKPSALVFDESHYVPAARNYLSGGGLLNPEHPPLGKWFIAGGILIFGDNPVGWRIASVIFGVASIFIFYFICVHLCRKEITEGEVKTSSSPVLPNRHSWFTMTTFVPVFATFLFASENMSFVQAQIAMLDVFYITFMLLGFLFYLRGNSLSCGIVMGLSMLCKTISLLAILAIILHWAVIHRHEVVGEIRRMLNTMIGKKSMSHCSALLGMGKLLVTAAIMWVILLPLLEYPASHQFFNPISRTLYILRFHLDMTISPYPGATTPWTWVISPTNLIYWPDPTFLSGHWAMVINSANPLYWAATSWNIWAFIILSMLYLTYEVVRYRAAQYNMASFALSWFFAVYVLLIPIELITGRLMYAFYFYPAIPAVCMAIAWSAWKLWSVMRKERKRRLIFLSVLTVYLISSVVIFFFMSPFGGHFLLHA